jgi:hypothetical protein
MILSLSQFFATAQAASKKVKRALKVVKIDSK